MNYNYLCQVGRGDGQAVPGALLVGPGQRHELGHPRHGVRDLLVDVHRYQAAAIDRSVRLIDSVAYMLLNK